MNVTTAAAALPQIYSRPARANAEQPCSPTRPATEWWEVGEQKFDSTSSMLSQLQVGDQGAEAVYHYKTTADSERTLKDFVKEQAISGAIGGAILGVVGVVGINVLGTIASIMTAGFYGMFQGVALAAPVAACAAGGALLGALTAKESFNEFQANGHSVYGTVMSNNGQLVFHPGNELQNRVDLAAHAQAPVEADTPNCTPWWQRQQSY